MVYMTNRSKEEALFMVYPILVVLWVSARVNRINRCTCSLYSLYMCGGWFRKAGVMQMLAWYPGGVGALCIRMCLNIVAWPCVPLCKTLSTCGVWSTFILMWNVIWIVWLHVPSWCSQCDSIQVRSGWWGVYSYYLKFHAYLGLVWCNRPWWQ